MTLYSDDFFSSPLVHLHPATGIFFFLSSVIKNNSNTIASPKIGKRIDILKREINRNLINLFASNKSSISKDNTGCYR